MKGYLDKASCWQAVLGKSVKQDRYICCSSKKIEDIGFKNVTVEKETITGNSQALWHHTYNFNQKKSTNNNYNGSKMHRISSPGSICRSVLKDVMFKRVILAIVC
jgi:hypothetical protein